MTRLLQWCWLCDMATPTRICPWCQGQWCEVCEPEYCPDCEKDED